MAVAAPSFDEEFVVFIREPRDDPRDFYDRLRAAAPMYFTPHGYWFVSSFPLADELWKDGERWLRKPIDSDVRHPLARRGGAAADFFTSHVLSLDGAEHRRI